MSYLFDSDSSRFRQNKSVEVRSSDLADLDVELYSPITHYSEKHISAPRRCCDPKSLHALENYKVLLAHSPPRTGAPLQLFFKAGSKIGLKCNKSAFKTLELESAIKLLSLTSAPLSGNGSPSYNFFKRGFEIGLKCNKCALITSELRSVAQRNYGILRASRLGC